MDPRNQSSRVDADGKSTDDDPDQLELPDDIVDRVCAEFEREQLARRVEQLRQEVDPTEPLDVWRRIDVLAARVMDADPAAAELVTVIAHHGARRHYAAAQCMRANQIAAMCAVEEPEPREARLTDEQAQQLEQWRVLLEQDASRALDSYEHVTRIGGEPAYILAGRLRQAALPLTSEALAACRNEQDKRTQEERALIAARSDPRVGGFAEEALLDILHRFALPRQTNGSDARVIHGLSATEEADLVRGIVGGHSAEAVLAAMQRAARGRAAYHGQQPTEPAQSEAVDPRKVATLTDERNESPGKQPPRRKAAKK